MEKEKQLPKTLWKYTKGEFLKSILENGLYVAPIFKMNDPYEYVYVKDRERYRICCVSERKSVFSKYMLTHFADGHKGYAIGFNYEGVFRAVKYSKWAEIKKELSNYNVENSLTVKDKKWHMEHEYRAIYDAETNSKGFKKGENGVYLPVTITNIVLCCETENTESWIDQLDILRKYKSEHPKVEIKKLKMDDKKFSFIFDKEWELN